MIGAIAGDIIGSPYEHHPIKTTDFPLFSKQSRFTDDTVLTIATAYAVLEGLSYGESYKLWSRQFPNAGYGGMFRKWMNSEDNSPYNSWGNGAAMRVSPVGFAFDTEDDVLKEAEKSACVTHNHPEGVKGAQAAALSVFYARQAKPKDEIKICIEKNFGYDLSRTVAEIRPSYSFDVSCQGTVPESIIAFLESHGVEDAIRIAVSLGGDSDTLGCITGAIAHAYYQTIPDHIQQGIYELLPNRMRTVIERFTEKYN